MRRFFALFVVGITLVPALVWAQSQVPIVTLTSGTQPTNGTVTPNQTLPVTAVTLQANSTTTVNGFTVQRVGSAPDAAIVELGVIDTTTGSLAPIGTAAGFNAEHKATIPLSITLGTGERKTVAVTAKTASNLSTYQGQFFQLNIVAVSTGAVLNGPLPVVGAQLTLHSGFNKPTCQLAASPSTYVTGQTVILAWTSTNATGGTITGLGSVGAKGSQAILPTGTGTYTGTFTGPGGTGTCSVAVTKGVGTGGGGNGGVQDPGTVGSPGKGTEGSPGSTVTPTVGQPGVPTVSTPVTASPNTGDSRRNLTLCTGLNCQLCSLAQLGQGVVNVGIGLLIPFAAALFAWAGILYFTSGVNQHNLERAKATFQMVFWGFVIAITAWLIIQTLLRVLLSDKYYQTWNRIECSSPEARIGTTPTNTPSVGSVINRDIGTTKLGPTGAGLAVPPGRGVTYVCNQAGFTLTSGTTECVHKESGAVINATPVGYTSPSYGTYFSALSRLCPAGNENCSVELLQNKYGLDGTKATTMSCIAMTESTGMAWKCSGTGPCGTFQISKTNWRNYATGECTAAAFGGDIERAQKHGICNAQVMAAMVEEQGYQPWTGQNPGQAPWNLNARKCVEKYDPSAVSW